MNNCYSAGLQEKQSQGYPQLGGVLHRCRTLVCHLVLHLYKCCEPLERLRCRVAYLQELGEARFGMVLGVTYRERGRPTLRIKARERFSRARTPQPLFRRSDAPEPMWLGTERPDSLHLSCRPPSRRGRPRGAQGGQPYDGNEAREVVKK